MTARLEEIADRPFSQPQLHIRFDGRSIDLDLNELDLGPQSGDEQVRTSVARYLQVPVQKIQTFRVDRNEATGDIGLRPEAVFG